MREVGRTRDKRTKPRREAEWFPAYRVFCSLHILFPALSLLFAFIEGAGFVIDMRQSMKFQSDREYLGQNYKDTGYLKKNSMEWKIF